MRSVGTNAALMAASRVASAGLSIVGIGILTRSLGPASYGDWSIIIAVGTILHAVADWGLAALASRDLARPNAREGEVVRAYVRLRATIALAAFAVGIAASWVVPFSAAVRTGILAVSAFFIVNSLSQILIVVFQKHLAMHWVAFSDLAAKGVFVAGVAALARTYGIAGAIVTLIVSGVVQFSLLRWAVRFFAAPTGLPPAGWVREALRESWPMAISISFVLLYFKGDAILLSFLKPREDVAIYGLGYSVLENLIYFPAMFMGLMISRLVRQLHRAPAAFRELLQRLFDLFWLAGLPIAVGLWFASPGIAELLGGSAFRPSAGVIAILGVAIAVIFFGNLFGSAVIVLGRQREAIWSYLGGFATMVAVNLALIPRFSYLGTAWATVATELVVTALLIRIVCRFSGFHPRLFRVWRAAFAAAALGLVLWLVRDAGLITLAVAGVASYVAAAWLLGAFRKDDLALFRMTDAREAPVALLDR